nr:YbhN family protein [Rhodoplanes tepidamans]
MLKPRPEPRAPVEAPDGDDPPAASAEASEPTARGPAWLVRVRALLAGVRWNWVGAALACTIIGVSMVVLYNVLSDIELDKIRAGLKDIPPENLVKAGLCVAMAYATLTLYDWFALRTLGIRHVPYRVAGMVSFTSYTIGHNIGATAFSAGAIRWRIYSAYGLGLVDVAKICFITGLTFWLGNLAVLGLAMIYDPGAVSAVDQLAPAVNRLIGVALLVGLASWVAWVWARPRTIGVKKLNVRLPGGRSTLLQICIGITDLTFCSLAMFMLVPGEPHIHFFTLAGIFIAATLLGFASHAPGSIGVFDAAMLVGLPFFDKEELIAGLLIFRLMYFVVPFACSLTIMGIREVVLSIRRRKEMEAP